MALSWIAKFDPDEIKDYSADWEPLLDGDTLSSSSWTLPTEATTNGLEIDTSKPSSGEPFTDTSAIVWLKVSDPDNQASALIAGQPYLLENTVTTSGNRTYQRTFKLKIKEL